MATSEGQLDLFAARPAVAAPSMLNAARTASPDVQGLSDEALLEQLPNAAPRDCQRLLQEIAKRKMRIAIGAIEALALRHIGFGKERIVAEQAAAIEALESLGGVEAAQALGRLITRRTFDGPCFKLAMTAAARLNTHLPEELTTSFLRHDDPEIRAAAARCTRIWPKATPVLIELLDDLHDAVRIAAACALGRMGRSESRSILLQALCQEPTEAVIEAVAGIGDEELIVLLGRVALRRLELAGAVLEALEIIDHPRAEIVAAGIGSRCV